mmetsp:Transcript_8467/g.14569  ORF Transcript_8467/g.14569 Transcript_8467/m.14569 type:complete len:409 (-) Transcript_8467:648-1874(-)
MTHSRRLGVCSMSNGHFAACACRSLIVCWLALAAVCECRKPTEFEKPRAVSQNVFERGIVNENVDYAEILNHSRTYHKDVQRKIFGSHSLGFVSMTESSYEFAKTFKFKFTHLSPIWYEVALRKPGDLNSLVLNGSDNFDHSWVKAIRTKGGKGIKICPYFHFRDWAKKDLEKLMNDYLAIDRLNELITEEVKKRSYDGVTIQVYDSLASLHVPALRSAVHRWLMRLANALRKDQPLQLVLVVPPSSQAFTDKDYSALNTVVDLFVLATHTSAPTRAAPLAPLPWMRSSAVQLVGSTPHAYRKVPLALALNFFGADYRTDKNPPAAAEPIAGAEYLKLLDKHKPKIEWDAEAHEHVHRYTKKADASKHDLYHPTLKSVKDRIDLATELGAGIAVWELGNSLEYLYDLL